MQGVSVILTTYNRPRLAELVRVHVQSQRGVEVEFIVIDDGSDPIYDLHSDIVVRRKDDGYHHLWCMNMGLSVASHENVIFLDDDTVPQGERWAAEHLRVLDESDVSRGPFVMAKYDGPKLMEASAVMYGRRGTHFTTTNVGFRRGPLMEVGAMQMDFDGHYGYGDIDLWLRMEDADISVGYAGNDAFALHLGEPNQSDTSRNLKLLQEKWGDRVAEIGV